MTVPPLSVQGRAANRLQESVARLLAPGHVFRQDPGLVVGLAGQGEPKYITRFST